MHILISIDFLFIGDEILIARTKVFRIFRRRYGI